MLRLCHSRHSSSGSSLLRFVPHIARHNIAAPGEVDALQRSAFFQQEGIHVTLRSGEKSSVRKELHPYRKHASMCVTLLSGVKSSEHKELHPARKPLPRCVTWINPDRLTLVSEVQLLRKLDSIRVTTHSALRSRLVNDELHKKLPGITVATSACRS